MIFERRASKVMAEVVGSHSLDAALWPSQKNI